MNTGQPSVIALWLHFLDLREGDRALHVGCGLGYFTAIVADVVGPGGHVTAIEIDPELASRAKKNLAHLDHVEVLHGDGGEYDPGPADAILINAGVTHPRSVWLDSLRPDGRMIIPLTTESGRGGVLRVKRDQGGYAARFILTTQIFPCAGGREKELSRRLSDGFRRGRFRSVQSMRREAHEPDKECWFHADGFCLSTRPLPTG